jgi:hypothetical protein
MPMTAAMTTLAASAAAITIDAQRAKLALAAICAEAGDQPYADKPEAFRSSEQRVEDEDND